MYCSYKHYTKNVLEDGASLNNSLYKSTHYAMGTVFEVLIYSERDDYFLRTLTEQVFEELERYEQEMSVFIEGSGVDFINKCAGKRPVRVSPEVYEIIKTSIHYSGITGGCFDITVGPLMQLWGFYKKRNSQPSEDEIADTLKRVGYGNIILNEDDRSVFLKNEGMMIDFGGIAKGWSIKQIGEKLRSFRINNFLINAGTSSVYASGTPVDQKHWTAALPEVRGFRLSVEEVCLKDNAVSVSGTYENTVEYGNKKYPHVINPVTGKPESSVVMAVVIAPEPLECEILSTAFTVMGVRGTKEFLKGNIKVLLLYIDENNKLQEIELSDI